MTDLHHLRQLAETLARFYPPPHQTIHLLLVPKSIPRIKETLKFDMAEHGERYWHLYEGLQLKDEVGGHIVLKRGADGGWDLPRDLVF